MKKVLVIAPYPYLPYFSGGQKSIARFLEYLGKETSLTVITPSNNDAELAVNYKVLPWLKNSSKRYIDLGLVKKIVALVKEEGFQTLIIEHPYLAWMGFSVRKKTGIRVIIHTHNTEYQRFRSLGKWWWPILKVYERRSFRKADGLIFVSPEDKAFAIKQWKIGETKCHQVAFGIDTDAYPVGRGERRKMIAAKHHIPDSDVILSFNGLLDYKPNLDALKVILNEINPRLMQEQGFRYKIIISGKRLPDEFNSLKEYQSKNIVYTGFVEDIIPYFEATDIFLNPIMSGGGIKTKMVEAIGYGATVISTITGAAGMEQGIAGTKLVCVADNDWDAFVKKIIAESKNVNPTQPSYYNFYFWGNIARDLVPFL